MTSIHITRSALLHKKGQLDLSLSHTVKISKEDQDWLNDCLSESIMKKGEDDREES